MYEIVIQGTGPIHSGNTTADADTLARELISKLQAAGHSLSTATATYTPPEPSKIEEDLLQPPTP